MKGKNSKNETQNELQKIDAIRYFGGELPDQDIPTIAQLLANGWDETGAGNGTFYQETENCLTVFYIPKESGFFIEIGDKEFAPKDMDAISQLLIDLDYQKGLYGAIL